MRNRTISAAATVSLCGGLIWFAAAHRGSAQAPARLATDGTLQIVSVNENGNPVNNGYPNLIRDRKGVLWCAWVSARLRDPMVKRQNVPYEEGDMIVLRARKGAEWGAATILNSNFGVNFAPVLAEDSVGNIITVWGSRREGVDGIWWRRTGADLSLGNEMRVAPAGKLETKPSLAAAPDGKLWLAFQSYRNGSPDIVFYGLEGSGWQRMADPAESPDPEYRPRLAAAPDGGIWCAWDAYSKGKYRVMLRRYDPKSGAWGAAEAVPGDGILDTYAPDLAVDCERPGLGGLRAERGGGAGPRSPRDERRRSAEAHHAPGGARRRRCVVDCRGDVRQRAWVCGRGDLPRISIDDEGGGVWVVWQKLPDHIDWKVGAAYYRADDGWRRRFSARTSRWRSTVRRAAPTSGRRCCRWRGPPGVRVRARPRCLPQSRHLRA